MGLVMVYIEQLIQERKTKFKQAKQDATVYSHNTIWTLKSQILFTIPSRNNIHSQTTNNIHNKIFQFFLV